MKGNYYGNIKQAECNNELDLYIDEIQNLGYTIIEIYKDKPLYAFGYGEIAKTILPYSDLDNYIISYIDDYNRRSKTISTDEAKLLFKDRHNVNIVFLVNPTHVEKGKSIFNGFNNIEFIDIFKGIKGDLQ
jgi:CRISPR/Cas system-associated protein Cas5 (RAMP superfamily)